MKFAKSPWIKVLIVILVLSGIFLILRSLNIDFSQISEEEFKNWVKSSGLWGPVIYIVVYLFRPLILFPAGVLSAAAGVIWGPLVGFLYLQVAANISSTAEFLIGRYFARDLVTKYLKGKMFNLDEKIEQHGFLTVLLIRLIPNVAWDLQNLSLGLTKVKFRHYFIATLIGIMPGSFAFVFFGSSLIRVLFDPKNFWVIILAVLVFIGVYFLQKYLKAKQKSQSSVEVKP